MTAWNGGAARSARFVGRTAELRYLAEVLRASEVVWLTGAIGIGKTAVALEAIGARAVVHLDGRAMASAGEAVRHVAAVTGEPPPPPARAEAAAAWIARALAAIAPRTEAVLVDDLERADRAVATELLRLLRRTAVGCPVIAIGRESWSAAELVGGRVHHLQLHELSDADTEAFARAYGRSAGELAPAAAGHPVLMDLCLRTGAGALDERIEAWIEAWIDSLLGELAPHGALLGRLAVAQSPVQLRWAIEGHGEAELERLRAKGMYRRGRGMLRSVAHGIARRLDDTGQRDDLERELLAYLASRPTLGELDLARALQLAIRHGAHERLAELVARHAAAASTVVQRTLTGVLCNRRVPAAAKLASFHALAEHITLVSVEDFLRVHDSLIDSADPVERRVAQVSLLRAAFISGHRRWPREAAAYLDEIAACPLVPDAVKEQIRHLWAFRAVHARARPSDLADVLDQLTRSGLDAPTLRAYRRLFAGVELTYQYRLREAIDELRESAGSFAACGRQLHVDWVQRYLLALCYSGAQHAQFHELLAQIGASSRDHLDRDHRYRFFRAIDDWNRGDGAALEEECARAAAVPPSPPSGHALLPGPYLADCQAACFHAIRDRARAAPLAPQLVDHFVELLDRMMITVPPVLAAQCLAQHAWLAGDRDALARLRAALRSLGPVGAMHAHLLGSLDELRGHLTDAAPVLELLERVVAVREPLVTPYYVVIASRLLAQHRLAARGFVAHVRAHPQLADLPLRARWVIEAALRALGAEGDRALAVPDGVARAVHAQVHAPAGAEAGPRPPLPAAPTDGSVEALKQLIDRQWHEGIRLDDFARENNLSRFAISRRFKTATGKSPRRYLQETRINEAKRLLTEADWTVTQIAFECGFSDGAQFSRLFKQATGMTPVGFRRAHERSSPERTSAHVARRTSHQASVSRDS